MCWSWSIVEARDASTPEEEEDGAEDEDRRGLGVASSFTWGLLVASYLSLLLIDSLLIAPMT